MEREVRRIGRAGLFLYLEEERIVFTVAFEIDEVIAQAHTAGANDLECDIDRHVLVEEVATLRQKAVAISGEAGKHGTRLRRRQRREQRRLFLEEAVTGFVLRLVRDAVQCAERSFTLRLLQGFGDGGDPLEAMHLIAGKLQHRHTRQGRGKAAVIGSEDVHGVATGGRLLPVFASCEHDTGGHALEIPFEGRGAGFIEVIDIEDEATIRCGVGTEVAHVGIAADLRDDAGVGQCGEVGRHDRHSAAKETEGRSEHAFVLQRDEGRDASSHGARDSGHRGNAAEAARQCACSCRRSCFRRAWPSACRSAGEMRAAIRWSRYTA